MTKRPDLPLGRSSEASRTAAVPSTAGGAKRVDVRGWLGGVRLSAFMLIMLLLVVLAVFVLVPTISTYVGQKQRIAALQQSVQVTQQQVDELKSERDRWNDKAYITTQARERLYYVRPGEVVYLIDDDLPPEAVPKEQKPVSSTVQETKTDWSVNLLRSVTNAGLAKNAVTAPATTPTPKPTQKPTGK